MIRLTKVAFSPVSPRCRYFKDSVMRTLATTTNLEEISESLDSAIPDSFKSPFLQTMLDRGYINQCTDFKGLDERLNNGTSSAYLGFDATATSLHVGSLLQIMILRILQKSGHKPIILIGGGTTKVGDPTGKDESRQLLSEEIIKNNADSLSRVFEKFITFGTGSTDAIMVNNADWLDKINYLEFLRDYGRYFTINRMLSFESVKQRLAREQPLTFLEFNYMLLQAFDFLQLQRKYGTCLQLGGSDQWGNIISGIELNRKVDQKSVFGLTAPLMTTSDGKKMGKTASGALWLNKDLLSEYDYWQFWRNVADDDVIRFLKLFTEIPLEEINKMKSWEGSALNEAKKILADAATTMLHGPDCLPKIHATVQSLYGGNGADGNDLDSLPTISEAKRLIKGGGARINGEKVDDELFTVTSKDFDENGRLKLSSGKKKHVHYSPASRYNKKRTIIVPYVQQVILSYK
eukprot:gene11810-24741_t